MVVNSVSIKHALSIKCRLSLKQYRVQFSCVWLSRCVRLSHVSLIVYKLTTGEGCLVSWLAYAQNLGIE